jgi:hypothetical protein
MAATASSSMTPIARRLSFGVGAFRNRDRLSQSFPEIARSKTETRYVQMEQWYTQIVTLVSRMGSFEVLGFQENALMLKLECGKRDTPHLLKIFFEANTCRVVDAQVRAGVGWLVLLEAVSWCTVGGIAVSGGVS